jgi:hypothetical protein
MLQDKDDLKVSIQNIMFLVLSAATSLCNELHVCFVQNMSATKSEALPAPSLNMVNKHLTLTVVHWAKLCGPQHAAN